MFILYSIHPVLIYLKNYLKKKKRFANFIIVKNFSIAYTFLRGDNKMTRG